MSLRNKYNRKEYNKVLKILNKDYGITESKACDLIDNLILLVRAENNTGRVMNDILSDESPDDWGD